MSNGKLTLEDARSKIDAAKAVIFDNDGTLVDSMPIHYDVWRQALSEHGIRFTEEQFYDWAGMPAADIVRALAHQQNVEDYSVTSILQARQERLEKGLRNVTKVEVVVDLLEYARERGVPLAIASGTELGDVLGSLNYAGIDDTIFSTIVTAEDVTMGKPDPEPFLTAASRLGVPPSQCIGLEDGDKGLQALDAAGMHKIDVRLIQDYPLPRALCSKF